MTRTQYAGNWQRIRRAILERDNYTCTCTIPRHHHPGGVCALDLRDNPSQAHVDHIVSVATARTCYSSRGIVTAAGTLPLAGSWRARVQAAIAHPNVLPVLDVIEEEGLLAKARDVQWDYEHIVRNRGLLKRRG